MKIKTFVEGPIDANNYLLIDETSNEAILIDCSSPRLEFINSIKETGVSLKAIFLTHGHFDHLLGIDKFREEFGVDVYIAQEDISQVKLVPNMTQMFLGMPADEISEITHFVNDGDEFEFGNIKLKAISTAGHTRGGMCYLIEDKLFSGDTLFKNSVGRCDLFEGNLGDITKNIKEKLFVLSDDIVVYPGHGPSTTIGHEKKYNEILNI